jgi:hypothetical protein
MIVRRIASLWRGEQPLARVFWEYGIGWGTLINLVCTGAALVAFLNNAQAWLGLLLHFAATPYNMLMVASVWRAAARESDSPFTNFARGGILVWFLMMLVF